MPAPFGLTTEGLNPMRLADVLDQLADDLRAQWGQNIRTDDRSVIGQIIGVIAERVGDVWTELEKAYAAAYLSGAEDAALDDLVALAAIARRPASLSVVALTITGTNGTVIPAGSIVRDPETLEQWTTLALATIALGTASVSASPTRTGPVLALTGTLTEIVTPISGWTSVTNATDATRGRDVESNSALRTRYGLSMRAGGGSAVEAIRAAILRIADVTECAIIENETAEDDADGRPPKSFETVVRGGIAQTIVDAIWFGKPAGIETYGNTSGTAVDGADDGQTVNWSRPVERPVYIIVDYTPEIGFEDDGEDQILAAILDYASTFTLGRDVVPLKFVQHIEVEHLHLLSLRVGFAPNPPISDPLAISRTELATFDSSHISFNPSPTVEG